jgi:hypothetical protein
MAAQKMHPGWGRNIKRVPCRRCGIERQDGGNVAQLCGDCRSVLTAREREMWAA